MADRQIEHAAVTGPTSAETRRLSRTAIVSPSKMLGINRHPASYDRLTAIVGKGSKMQAKVKIAGALFLSLVYLTSASAQTPGQVSPYSPPSVGQAPTYTSKLPNGAPVVHTPEGSAIFATPTPNGGYVIQTPGQQPMYINPQ